MVHWGIPDDTCADSIDNHLLYPVREVTADPVNCFSTHSIVMQFELQSMLGNFVKRLNMKSGSVTSICSLASNRLARSCTVLMSWLSDDLRFMKPCCWSDMVPCLSKWLMIWPCRICSTTLQHTDVKDTGRQFEALALSPFLNSGVSLAAFQSPGILPWLTDA